MYELTVNAAREAVRRGKGRQALAAYKDFATEREGAGARPEAARAWTPAVVTTLWKVDDRASFVLIRAFYEALAERDPAQALREAQRLTAKEYGHPFAWAAFGLTGVP